MQNNRFNSDCFRDWYPPVQRLFSYLGFPVYKKKSLDKVWSPSVFTSRNELSITTLFPMSLLTMSASNFEFIYLLFPTHIFLYWLPICVCVFIALNSSWYICWWLWWLYCRGPAQSSYTLLLSYWHPSKTNKQSWEKRLERPVRNTMCFSLDIVCLMISVGFWHPALTFMVNCWKPA